MKRDIPTMHGEDFYEEEIMATFVKGDWVEIVPRPDYSWEHWSQENTDLCGKTGQVTSITEGDWVDEIFIEVEYRGVRAWFGDKHLIKVKKYKQIFEEAIHQSCERLQRHEKVCKKLRDEILNEVFGDPDSTVIINPPEPEPEPDDTEPIPDELFEDWEELTTKEIIPLPGNGGTMTTPDDPKASTSPKKKKIKSLGKKTIIKKNTGTKSLTDVWTLSDDDIKELENYLDSISTNTSGHYDYEYFDSD